MSQAETDLRITATRQTVEWTVKNFDRDLILRNVVSRSRTFHFDGTKLCLKFYCRNRRARDVLLILNLSADAKPCRGINCTLGIKRFGGSVIKSFRAKIVDCINLIGIAEFVKMSEILEVPMTKDSSVTFFCILSRSTDDQTKQVGCRTASPGDAAVDTAEGTVSSESVNILAQSFKNLYISGLHSDVIIKVEDRQFPAHKFVLSSRSPVFAAMFEHEMAEKLSGVVDIADCDAPCFEAFLLFLYTGDAVNVTLENAMVLYMTAEKYQVKALKETVVQFLKEQLQLGTIGEAVHLAMGQDETDPPEVATDFFINNLSTILASSQWEEFLGGIPLMANELFIERGIDCIRK